MLNGPTKQKGLNQKYEDYEMKNLISKGKYRVKVISQTCIKLAET